MALSKIVADSVGSNAVTTAALSDSGVTAGSYGNTTAIPVITVDAKGRITSATTNSVSGVTGVSFTSANNTVTVSTSTTDFSANINASLNTTYSNATSYADTKAATAYSNATSYADTKAATAYSNGVTYSGTIAATAYSNAVSTASADATTKAATAYTNAVAYAASNTYVNSTFAPLAGATFTGGVTVSNTIATGNNTITGFANITGSLTVGGVATITGNLVVNGTTITVNTSQINTTDSLMYLASNNEVSDSIDIGLAGHYNNGAGANGHTGFIRSAVTKKWYLFQNYQPEFFANNTVDIANTATGIQMADLVVGNLVANSTLTVTGAATLSNTLSVTGTSTFTGLITGTITSANNADYLDGQHGTYYAANSQLASYALLSGATYTGALTSNNGFRSTLAGSGVGESGLEVNVPQNSTAGLILGQNNVTNWRIVNRASTGTLEFATATTGSVQASLTTSGALTTTTLTTGNTTVSGTLTLTAPTGSIGWSGKTIISSPSSNASFIFADRANTTTGEAGFGWSTGGTNKWIAYMPTSSDDLRFYQGSTSTVTFAANGNVGIGNTTPAHKLSVNGTVNITNGPLYFNSNSSYYIDPTGSSKMNFIDGDISRIDVGRAPRTEFTVGGNASTFYPVRLDIAGGPTAYQYSTFQIERGGYDDPGYTGIGFSTLHARFSCTSSGWGFGADYIHVEHLKQTTNHIAQWTQEYQTSTIIIWLRGATVYNLWSIVGQFHVLDGNASGGNVVTPYNTYTPTTTVQTYAQKSRTFDSDTFTSGAIYATGNVVANYSDERLKTKVGPIVGALDKVKQLSGFYYKPNEKARELGYSDELQVGVSAQDVENVLPEIVQEAPIDKTYKTISYERLVPLLIEAIKEQDAKIEDLNKRLADKGTL